MPGQKPTSLADVIKRAMRSALAEVHTMIPGRVERVNMDGDKIKSVDAQPLIKLAYYDEEGLRVVESLPQIPNCPVHFFGAGNYRVTVPIARGDVGQLVFSEASLDTWLGRGDEVDPNFDHRANISDAVFFPGLRDFAHLWNAPADRMTIGKDDGLQVHIDGSRINIGTNVAADLEPSTLGQTLMTYLNSLRVWDIAHVHTSSVPGSPTTVPVVPPPSVPDVRAPSVQIKKT